MMVKWQMVNKKIYVRTHAESCGEWWEGFIHSITHTLTHTIQYYEQKREGEGEREGQQYFFQDFAQKGKYLLRQPKGRKLKTLKSVIQGEISGGRSTPMDP